MSQRPVEWILYSPESSTALIVITEEAEDLIPILRRQRRISPTHLLAYSPPVTKRMLSVGSLKFYAIPALPTGHAMPCLTI